MTPKQFIFLSIVQSTVTAFASIRSSNPTDAMTLVISPMSFLENCINRIPEELSAADAAAAWIQHFLIYGQEPPPEYVAPRWLMRAR